MALRVIQFLAIILTALALVPSGAHLAALPDKMTMTQAAYFVAQQVYAGWALFGIVLFGAFDSESGARDRAAQAGPVIWLRDRLIFVYCCWPCHLLRRDPCRQIKRPATGPLCLRTGMSCVANGNIRTPPTPS